MIFLQLLSSLTHSSQIFFWRSAEESFSSSNGGDATDSTNCVVNLTLCAAIRFSHNSHSPFFDVRNIRSIMLLHLHEICYECEIWKCYRWGPPRGFSRQACDVLNPASRVHSLVPLLSLYATKFRGGYDSSTLRRPSVAGCDIISYQPFQDSSQNVFSIEPRLRSHRRRFLDQSWDARVDLRKSRSGSRPSEGTRLWHVSNVHEKSKRLEIQ